MADVKITSNIKQIAKKLGTTPRKISIGLTRAIRASAFLVQAKARKISPVDTGLMRRSIEPTIHLLQATIAPNVVYAVYVHEGTRFMQARPFMRDAKRQSLTRIRQQFRNEIIRAIR